MENFLTYFCYKTHRANEEVEITLDSNMVGYLYCLYRNGDLSATEFIALSKNRENSLTAEHYNILMSMVRNNFKGFKFYTTPQVVHEVRRCAQIQNDNGIVKFLERLCKVKLPREESEKHKHATLIEGLMNEYLVEDIPLSNNERQLQSAVKTETKNGAIDCSDAKIVAENTILHGTPIVTRNEKHLISIKQYKRRNKLRSEAILDKNKVFLSKTNIENNQIKRNLKNEKSTTFRINEIPDLTDGRFL